MKKFVIAKGGSGGFGNARFKSATRQTPRFAKPGLPGQSIEIILELKMVADVGLIGFPNVGKSTLLSVVSTARPKIANYHFTTLTPNLGVVGGGDGFVLADIPGLVEGAASGLGLGHEFLRHIERTRLLIHVVDVSGSEGRNPIDDFEIINKELSSYSEKLAKAPQIVAGNKCDLIGDEYDQIKNYVEKKGFKFFPISAATSDGVRHLMDQAAAMLADIKKPERFESEFTPYENSIETDEFEVTKHGDIYSVSGSFVDRLISAVNFDEDDSVAYFQRSLRARGVIDRLLDMGIQEGETVRLNDIEFDFIN